MPYYDTPIADEDQDVSQPKIRTNFQQQNTTYGTDHYAFDNGTANNGFHKQVTSPDQGGDVVTTTNPAFYAKIPSANIGLIQFSRGPSAPVASPVTFRQSPATPLVLAPAGTTNVLDFSGLTTAIAVLYAADPIYVSGLETARIQAMAYFSSTGPILKIVTFNTSQLTAQVSGTILRLINNGSASMSNVYWTLQFMRLQ